MDNTKFLIQNGIHSWACQAIACSLIKGHHMALCVCSCHDSSFRHEWFFSRSRLCKCLAIHSKTWGASIYWQVCILKLQFGRRGQEVATPVCVGMPFILTRIHTFRSCRKAFFSIFRLSGHESCVSLTCHILKYKGKASKRFLTPVICKITLKQSWMISTLNNNNFLFLDTNSPSNLVRITFPYQAPHIVCLYLFLA